VLPALVADWLGIDEDRVELRSSDPDGPELVGSGTIGSRTTMIQGSVLKLAADTLVQKGLGLAARMLDAHAGDIVFGEGHYRVKDTNRGISLIDLIHRHAGTGPHPLDTTAELPTVRAFPSGAHVAEVEIDPDTGAIEVVSYTAVDDIGTVINHVLADGQLRGGVVQGAGQVFGEVCHYDEETGQLVSGSFMDYPMPRSGLMPDIQVFAHSMSSSTNPLGSKGAGEAGTIGALPALMNAVANALRFLGVERVDMPATPSRLWRAIHRTGMGSPNREKPPAQ
jgi:carbon-monoxide dehydrogenase large subunit